MGALCETDHREVPALADQGVQGAAHQGAEDLWVVRIDGHVDKKTLDTAPPAGGKGEAPKSRAARLTSGLCSRMAPE